MSDHDHAHEHTQPDMASMTMFGALDPAETVDLKREAAKAGATNLGYLLGMAASCEWQSEREHWLGKVDSERYMLARQAARDKLSLSAQRNLDADERLSGTEATLNLKRVVGNACVLGLQPGPVEPEGGYSLVGRFAGHKDSTDHGKPQFGQWVVQGLALNELYEFAVVSDDSVTNKSVRGPWCKVPIGNVSLEVINAAEQERVNREYLRREEAHARAQEEHAAKVARQRELRLREIRAQEEAARIDRERREREHLERLEAHEKAVSELHLVAPRDLKFELRDLNAAGMVCDISFRRGEKKCQFFQFKVGGTVLGYFPDGRHSGRKPEDHVYRRTVQVPRGQAVEIHVYGVTKHGDGGNPRVVHVPHRIS